MCLNDLRYGGWSGRLCSLRCTAADQAKSGSDGEREGVPIDFHLVALGYFFFVSLKRHKVRESLSLIKS